MFLDGTVFRPPASGVHLAVREEVHALAACLPPGSAGVFFGAPEFPRPAAPRRFRPCPAPGWTRNAAGRILWQQCILPGLLKRLGAERLFSPAYTMPLAAGIPVMLHVHDLIALDFPEYCSRRNVLQMRLLLPPSVRKARRCLASSNYVADRILARLGPPADRLEVVPLGVDGRFFAVPRPRLPRLQRKRYFLFVGNIEPKKNLPLLLKAYAKFAERRPEVSLAVVGRDGWRCRKLCRQLRRWPGPGEVIRLGRIDDESLAAAYQGALACIVPSLVEGFGLPVLEAMAAGTPVLHSDCPALLETAGSRAGCFPRLDDEALLRKMTDIVESPSYADELSQHGRERALRFSWTKWGRTAAEVFLQM